MSAAVRVRVYAPDSELRTWLADELALLSPAVDVLAVETVQALDAGAELVIVGLDALTLADGQWVAELVMRRSPPVIAIGTPLGALSSVAFAHVLDAAFTSKQLKRAVRETLALAASAQTAARPGA